MFEPITDTKEQLIRVISMPVWHLTEKQKQKICDIIRCHDEMRINAPVSRAEAADILGVEVHSLDRWARQGMIERVYMPGATRASGYSRESIMKFYERMNKRECVHDAAEH